MTITFWDQRMFYNTFLTSPEFDKSQQIYTLLALAKEIWMQWKHCAKVL